MVKTMDMILGNCKFKNSFLIFSSICCRYTFELPIEQVWDEGSDT